MVSDQDVPDPTRPELIEFPDGSKKHVIGFSGQNIMIIDNLSAFVRGGLNKVHKVDLKNEFGFPFGGEINPDNKQPWGYSFDSSTWDVSLFKYKKENGQTGLRVLAGAMGTGSDAKPYMIKDGWNNTRQRIFFDAEFVSSPGGYKLIAENPKAVLNKGKPEDGNWIQKDRNGKIIFSHGYGGEPVTLANGDLMIDHRGWVPFVHETIVEQRETLNADGTITKIPYRTAIVVTYLDKTLNKIMQPSKIIFDVFKSRQQVWSAARRGPTEGPLVEGPHIEIQHQGKPVQSMAQMRRLQSAGAQIDYQMLFSAGEFFGHYGSYMAFSKGNLESFRPVLNSAGELEDFTAPLRVLFTWIGRPVSFHVDGKEYLLMHGVDRSSLPPGISLDVRPKGHQWQYFKRNEIVVPVERYLENGIRKIRIKDNGGLIELLKKYRPRKVSMQSVPSELVA
ncbi:MAG TPA: hypothetical protein VNJ01_08360 [Bacteriovoracaceae bacterium]|nr:hypothetical protein [Bacteriovoracaceae bacterium]